jgi:RNA polymerase sigma-70 factor (ECF subfamily)
LAAQRLLPDDFEQRATDVLDAQAERVRVAAAVGSLPAGERDALLLLAWEDLTYAEIAAALCVPIGTVRSRISRARLRMRAVLEEAR